jgi:hypothetical protein
VFCGAVPDFDGAVRHVCCEVLSIDSAQCVLRVEQLTTEARYFSRRRRGSPVGEAGYNESKVI